MSTGNRLFWVIRFLVLNLLLSIATSWRLWFQFEGIPQVGVIEQIPLLLPIVQKTVAAITIIYLLLLGLFPKGRFPIWIAVILMLVLSFQDWNRIQPWLVQSIGMLALLIPLQRLYRKYEPLEYLHWALRISVIGFYFWAGVFKFNDGFIDYIIPYVVSPITNYLTTFKPEIYAIASAFPLLQVLFAFGLLIRRMARYAVLGQIGLHVVTLLLVGPTGLNIHPIIWTWNITMIGVLWFGFGFIHSKFNFKFWHKTQRITWFALALFTILPILNFYNYYNKSIAFEIYSGTNYVDNLKMPLNEISTLNPIIEPYCYKYKDSLFVRTFELYDQEYNLPPNPDPKVVARLEQKLFLSMQ